jgi:bifunctional DNA-binding transcriptional regulator/antitoxin component of YhaV-PrlF toxin-antitoxin module
LFLAAFFRCSVALPFAKPNGIILGMKLKIDKFGRVVFPKALRRRLGVKPEIELEAVEEPDGVLVRPVKQQPSMVLVDGLWVHQAPAEPDVHWERVVDNVREERIQSVLRVT